MRIDITSISFDFDFMHTQPAYRVGYKCPPKSGQFKPGQSGNPKGRPPKQRENNIMRGMAKELIKACNRDVVLPSGKKLPLMQLAAHNVTTNVAKGDIKSINLVLKVTKGNQSDFERGIEALLHSALKPKG